MPTTSVGPTLSDSQQLAAGGMVRSPNPSVRDSDMAVTDVEEERVVRLLSQDLKATIGPGHEGLAAENASRLRQFIDEPNEYVARVVDDTQQDLHDFFIDTTWPRCPRHKRHPLWFRENAWWCEEDRVRVANLGELPPSVS